MLVSMSCFLFETGLEYAIFPIGTENNNENIITSFSGMLYPKIRDIIEQKMVRLTETKI